MVISNDMFLIIYLDQKITDKFLNWKSQQKRDQLYPQSSGGMTPRRLLMEIYKKMHLKYWRASGKEVEKGEEDQI